MLRTPILIFVPFLYIFLKHKQQLQNDEVFQWIVFNRERAYGKRMKIMYEWNIISI